MVKGLYTAWTGMVNAQNRMDVLSNNLANADTIGYKKEGATTQSFDDKLMLKIKDTSSPGAVRRLGYMHLGVKIGEVFTDYSQGSFQITDKPSDLAIAGQGFFAVAFTNKGGETSVKYTRDGEFTVDVNGYFRDHDGNYLLDANGAATGAINEANYVRIDPNQEYQIDQLGNVYQNGQLMDRIGVIDFDNYDYISKYGENFVDLLEGGNVIASTATLEQGTLETSNVNIIDEMVQMITLSRAYEAAQKVIQTEDSEIDKAINQVGKV
ncbi:MAG: flagellar hook-basal body protein [Lachnospiraceae bacterium]|nr:flagellar hook-basal body protein [Lachnospiraceae bacterium]